MLAARESTDSAIPSPIMMMMAVDVENSSQLKSDFAASAGN